MAVCPHCVSRKKRPVGVSILDPVSRMANPYVETQGGMKVNRVCPEDKTNGKKNEKIYREKKTPILNVWGEENRKRGNGSTH